MTMSASPALMHASPEEFAATLGAELRTEVSIWMPNGSNDETAWREVVSVEGHNQAEISAWLSQGLPRLTAGEPLSQPLATGHLRVATAFSRPRKTLLAAVADLPANPLRLAAESARIATASVARQQTADQLQAAIQDYVDQVSSDLEEMTYLRRITQFLEFLDVTTGLEEACTRILPRLRNLIRVEGLFLVIPSSDRESRPLPERLAFRCGDSVFGDELCLEILRALALESNGPVVRNVARCGLLSDLHPDLHSVSIVRIARDEQFFGWLMAVNREAGYCAGHHFATDSSEAELGTIETSLMEATATLLSSHAHNVRSFRAREELTVEIVRSLVAMLDARDAYTCGHSDRVAAMGRRLAELRGLSPTECETIYLSGLLHDIGKVGIPDEILQKPGPLTDDEFAKIQEHPQRGFDILRGIAPLQPTLPGVLHHHEAWDGSGYPHGLCGEQIPLIARILAVADTFDALTSRRPYRRPKLIADAVDILKSGRGSQWDADLIDTFLASLDDFLSICAGSNERLSTILGRAGLTDDTDLESQSDSLLQAVRSGVLRTTSGSELKRPTHSAASAPSTPLR